MPELDPANDFQDDGGTRAWRNNRATYSPVYDARPRRRIRWMMVIGWGIVYPLFAIAAFEFGSIALAATTGMNGLKAALIVGGILIAIPLNRFLPSPLLGGSRQPPDDR